MEGTDNSNVTQNIGHLPGWPLSSFLTANNDKNGFGSLRIPVSFYNEPENKLPSKVVIKCKEIGWKAKINSDKRLIYGLRRFMKFYDIKPYNLVQFNYHGNGVFTAKIFKETAIECNYPRTKNTDIVEFNEEEYNVDVSSVEFEKAYALWSFSAYENPVNYYDIQIIRSDLDKMYGNVRLNPKMKDLYQGWEVGKKVYIVFLAKTWEINVDSCAGEECFLGDGWYQFAKDSKLAVGDTLILYNIPSRGIFTLNACILKPAESVYDDNQGTEAWRKSFFKVLTEASLSDGVVVVPKSVKELYDEKLKTICRLEVGGDGWFIKYNSNSGYLCNLKNMMESFHLIQKETIVFRMDKSNVLYARIYEEDGIEINYASRKIGVSNNHAKTWFWDVVWEAKKGLMSDDGRINNQEEIMTDDVHADSVEMHFPKSVFPDFIICRKPDQVENGRMNIPEEIIAHQGENISKNVSLQFPSGREIHVRFSKEEKCFTNMFFFLKETGKFSGTIFVFSYKGEGKFLVNILNDDATEVEYGLIRSNPKGRVVNQDSDSGVGFKFLVYVTGSTYDNGELVVPDDFYKRFGRLVPAAVTFVLRNGEVFHGNYHVNDKRMSGLIGMIQQNHVQRKDIILLNYNGKGLFNIVIFQKTKVEKVLLGLEAQTDMDVDHLGAEFQPELDVGVDTTMEDVGHVSENEEDEAGEEEIVAAEQMELQDMQFVVTLALSHVNKTSHGVNIPRYIKPHNREWIAGEKILLNTNAGTWSVGIVLHNGLPRFSAGWNKFSKDNELQENQRLMFTLMDNEAQIEFAIQNP